MEYKYTRRNGHTGTRPTHTHKSTQDKPSWAEADRDNPYPYSSGPTDLKADSPEASQ